MSDLLVAILGGMIGVLAVVIGALSTFWFNRRSERQKLAIQHRQRQIKELYGPLNSLINRTKILNKIFEKMVITDPDGTEHRERLFGEHNKRHPEKLEGKDKAVWDFFADRYFIPINSQMRLLINKNYDLLNTPEPPESFQDFFKHEAQFKARRRMEKMDLGVTNKQVEDNPWEEKFNKDVEATLKQLKAEIEEVMGIKHQP